MFCASPQRPVSPHRAMVGHPRPFNSLLMADFHLVPLGSRPLPHLRGSVAPCGGSPCNGEGENLIRRRRRGLGARG